VDPDDQAAILTLHLRRKRRGGRDRENRGGRDRKGG
jgi:hypothetical protein